MNRFKHIQPSFLLLFVLLLLMAVVALAVPQGQIVLKLNGFHHPVLDSFFRYATYYGDGYILLVLFILFLLTSFRNAVMLMFISAIQFIPVQLMKRWIFSEKARPASFFDQETWNALHKVAGVDIHHWHSFPSGHTTTAFAATVLMMMVIRNEYIRSILVVAAFFAGLSRIYLLQHFMIDVATGAIIGSLAAAAGYYIFESQKWLTHTKFQHGVINYFI